MMYRTIDLCAGIGGIRKGFELTQHYKNVCSAEIDPLACKTYELLFGEDPQNDISSSEFKASLKTKQYDVLLAGFPCQAFSRVGLQLGFNDSTKGTVFFDIFQIIKTTFPKVVFLENVENLVNHDKGNTFMTIIESLELDLNYKVVGVNKAENGSIKYCGNDFIRNSKYFGLPQNRPRAYIIAFSRAYFGNRVDAICNELPQKNDKVIYSSVNDVLESDVPARFFLSEGYLKTLEKHFDRQKAKGYGFGYRIINDEKIEHPIANTLLATGGSGRERNLVVDKRNGSRWAGTEVKGKYSPINRKCIRTMTPLEWGRLQGFAGYAFLDDEGTDHFRFPSSVSNLQRFKQLGNSVTIPVIETMAQYIYDTVESMVQCFSEVEKRLFIMYGEEFVVCHALFQALGSIVRERSLVRMFDLVHHFGVGNPMSYREMSAYMHISEARVSQIMKQLSACKAVSRTEDGRIVFLASGTCPEAI